MGLTKEDMAKVPKGLSLNEYYARIYNWHMKNKNKIFAKLPDRSKDDPYIICYLELMRILPEPNVASLEDIAFVCREVLAGLMEWAYHEIDENGVKIAAYAHYILDTFFDGFNGSKTIQFSKNSKLYPTYSMLSCLGRYKRK
ncbi:MAG: hypothetical protein QXT57_01785 [Thermosphaera sp.]